VQSECYPPSSSVRMSIISETVSLPKQASELVILQL